MDSAVTMRMGRRCVGVMPVAPESLFGCARLRFVIPAKAGIHVAGAFAARGLWIPASAGMTGSFSGFYPVSDGGRRALYLSYNLPPHSGHTLVGGGGLRPTMPITCHDLHLICAEPRDLAGRIPTSEFVPFVMSSGAKRSRDICLRSPRTAYARPDPSAALGMTRGRPPVEMATVVTARDHENGMASRNESEFASACRPHSDKPSDKIPLASVACECYTDLVVQLRNGRWSK